MDEFIVTIDLPQALPVVQVQVTPSGPMGPQGPAQDLSAYLLKSDAATQFVSYVDLATESTTRNSSDIVQLGQLTGEVNARLASDATLAAAITAETAARIAADNGLQVQINAMRVQILALQNATPPPVTYTLTLTSDAGGTAAANAPSPYVAGTVVVITPVPDSAHSFNNWTLDGVPSSGNPLTITMNANRVLVAHWTTLPVPIVKTRVYANSSPWNTLLPSSPTLHPQSAAMVAALTDTTFLGDNNFQTNVGVGLHFTSDPTQFAFPTYDVDPTQTGTRSVHYTGLLSDVSASGVLTKYSGGGNVTTPFTGSEVPSPGSDGSFVERDVTTGDYWGGWQLINNAGVISATNMYVERNGAQSSGQQPIGFTARGPGMGYEAGTIYAHEMIAALAATNGDLGHRLGFAYDIVTPRWVEPWATKSDGQYQFPGMPEGAQLRFDPTITEANLRARIASGVSGGGPSLTETEIQMALVILRTGQKYGFVIVDHSGQRPGKIIPGGAETELWGVGSVPNYNSHVVWYLDPNWMQVLNFTDTVGLAANTTTGTVQWLDHYNAVQVFNSSSSGVFVRAELGGGYSFNRGDRTLFGASGGEAWANCTATNAGSGWSLPSVAVQDVRSISFFRPISLPVGGPSEFYVQLRMSSDARTYYQLRGRIDATTRHLKLTLQSQVAGTLTALNAEFDTGVVYTDLSKYIGVTFEAQGNGTTTLRARVWIATTPDDTDVSQPSTWQLTLTNTAVTLQAPGAAGLVYSLAVGSTVVPGKFFTTFWKGTAL